MQGYTVIHYTENGRDIFQEWLDDLRDYRARNAIQTAVDRVEEGNLGDHKPCREGVWKLRINLSAGYRVYYSISGKAVILLLCGGSKQTQRRDIDRSVEYWRKYKEEHK